MPLCARRIALHLLLHHATVEDVNRPLGMAGESGVGVLETSTREMLFIVRPPTSTSRVEPEEAALANGLPSTRIGVVCDGMPRTEMVRASNYE